MKPFKYDPATRELAPHVYPSEAAQWREYHGAAAWLYNPWTGRQRDARDVGSDPFGHLCTDGVTPLKAARDDYDAAKHAAMYPGY